MKLWDWGKKRVKESKSLFDWLQNVHIRKGNIMPLECASSVTWSSSDSKNSQRLVSTIRNLLMPEVCVKVATKIGITSMCEDRKINFQIIMRNNPFYYNDYFDKNSV